MSWSIDTAFIQTYHGELELQFQQFGSRLRSTVDVVTQRSEYDYFDRIGTVTAHEMTVRHGDTPLDDITHSRRRNQIVGFNNNLMFDNQDKLRTIIDPTSGYARSQAAELGRKMDAAIITAASGTAYSGKNGATSVAYDTAYRVAVNFVESGAGVNSNLTIGKLREARRLLLINEAIMDSEQVTLVLTASQEMSLLRSTETTSADYNTVKSLVNGTLDTFMGFKFVRTQLLAKATNTRTCLAYPKSGIKLGVAEELKTRIDERMDKNYSVQVYAEATFGATRMWEEKVIEILCDETS